MNFGPGPSVKIVGKTFFFRSEMDDRDVEMSLIGILHLCNN